jgi:hypothetical protein
MTSAISDLFNLQNPATRNYSEPEKKILKPLSNTLFLHNPMLSAVGERMPSAG